MNLHAGVGAAVDSKSIIMRINTWITGHRRATEFQELVQSLEKQSGITKEYLDIVVPRASNPERLVSPSYLRCNE